MRTPAPIVVQQYEAAVALDDSAHGSPRAVLGCFLIAKPGDYTAHAWVGGRTVGGGRTLCRVRTVDGLESAV